MWTTHSTFNDLISHYWNIAIDAPIMDIVPIKLKLLKQQLKIWNNSTFGNINTKLEKLESLVLDIEKEHNSNPSDNSWNNLTKAKDELNQVACVHQEFIRQKFKEDWVNFGDINSKMFHALLKNKIYYNHFHNFIKNDGSMKLIDELKMESINYF
jgi:hypothetical protein